MITHFYSDPHFGHDNIIKFCDRPFSDVFHMDAELAARYNAAVGPEDVVCWVGDCFFASRSRARYIMDQLNGRKWLVRGNHDSSARRMIELGFDMVTDCLWLDISGVPCRVIHYPPATFEGDKYASRRPPNDGAITIHGHTHSKERLRTESKTIHVGVDAWDYRPVTLAEVAELVEGM